MTTHREFLIAFAAICVCAFPQQHGSAAEPRNSFGQDDISLSGTEQGAPLQTLLKS